MFELLLSFVIAGSGLIIGLLFGHSGSGLPQHPFSSQTPQQTSMTESCAAFMASSTKDNALPGELPLFLDARSIDSITKH